MNGESPTSDVVYVLIYQWYDDSQVMGVFRTEEAAEARRLALGRNYFVEAHSLE